jgi:hypothetical protein
MGTPRISVVTPVLNGERFLEQTIRSVLEQEYAGIEYYIQDGGSSDNTVSVIRRFESEITGWVSQPDEGQADALNRAFERASGEILAWINADDFYEPGAFQAVAEVFAAQPDAVAVAGAAWITHPDGTRVLRRPTDVSRAGLLNWRRNWIAQPSVFFRRSAWQQVGPLDTSLHWAMDFDLWLELLDVGPIATTDRVLAAFRQHPEGKCSAGLQQMREETRRVVTRHATVEELAELYGDMYEEVLRLDDLCAGLLAEHVRRRWSELDGEVVLFGAGAHTPWLLGTVGGLAGPQVAAILDDNAKGTREIRGIPVVRPESLAERPRTVVLSSDTISDKLTARCRELFGSDIAVVDLYEGLPVGPYPKSDTHRAGWA